VKKIWRIVLLPAVGASLIDLHKGGRSKLDTAIFVTIDTKDIYKRFHSWFLKLIPSSYLRRIAAEESQCLLSSVAPSMLAFCFRNEGKKEEDEGRRESSFVHGRHMNQAVARGVARPVPEGRQRSSKTAKIILLQFTTSSLLVISAQHVTARLSFTINHSFLARIPLFTDVATKAQMNSRTVLCPDASDSITSSTSIASLSQHKYSSSSDWSQP
jgi:hypothetical protein